MAKQTHSKRAPTLLFLSGMLIEGVVGAVAFQELVGGSLDGLLDSVPDISEPAYLQAQPNAVSTTTPPPRAPEQLAGAPTQANLDTIDGHLEAARQLCYANLGDGVPMTGHLEITFDGGGAFASARLDGLSPMVQACVESEMTSWRIDGKGIKIKVTRTVSWQ